MAAASNTVGKRTPHGAARLTHGWRLASLIISFALGAFAAEIVKGGHYLAVVLLATLAIFVGISSLWSP